MILFGLFFMLIYGILVWYIGWTGWGWMKAGVRGELSWKLKVLYAIILTVVSISFVLGRLFDNVLLYVIGSYWMALFYLLIILLPLVHLSVLLLRFTRVPHYHLEKWPPIITLVLAFTFVSYGAFHAYSPTIQTYAIALEKENPSVDQLHIVMASDMHFGHLSGKSHAKRLVREINALKPDLVLFPGDIVDDEINQFVDQGIDEILAEIIAPHGVFVALGNHDKHQGPTEELIRALERGNLKVLYDEVITIEENIVLIGRRDRRDREREELASLIEEIDMSEAVILLDHQPYELEIAEQHGIDLMLSGHTHHGQVFPGNLITRQIYENDWGHLQKGKLHSVVSSGFGFWGPPIRIGSRSEIVQIVLSFGL